MGDERIKGNASPPLSRHCDSMWIRSTDRGVQRERRKRLIMICERCGKEISGSAAICPSCGMAISSAKASTPPPVTSYGQFPPGEYGDYSEYADPQPMPTYDQGYAPHQDLTAPPPIYTPAQQVPGPYHPYSPPP